MGRATRIELVALIALAAVAGASCASTKGAQVTPTVHASTTTSTSLVPTSADHDCVVGNQSAALIDWSALQNPILSSSSAGEKDEALIWDAGKWHMLFSYVRYDRTAPDGVYWDIATATSTDLVNWSAPVPWPAQRGALGVASPEIVQDPEGIFIATYQSDPGQVGGAQDRLYYRTSNDLETWSSPHPLAQNLAPAPGDRMIDGSLAFTSEGLILGYKSGVAGNQQSFSIAWSPSGSLDGPWKYVGKPDIKVNGDTIERDEFLTVDGSWRLVATSNVLDQPWIFKLSGNPDEPSGWLEWTDGYELNVPKAMWDTGKGISSVGYEWANSDFLCNDVAGDGYYYLLYAGSNELTDFGGWGHARIGIARSRNLVDWQVPG